MQQHHGIAASPGIGIGKSFSYTQTRFTLKDNFTHDFIQELDILETAFESVKEDLENAIARIKSTLGDKEASIFEAHLLFMEDPAIVDSLTKKIMSGRNAFNAVFLTFDEFIDRFLQMESEYMRDRIKDLQDIKHRILLKLEGKEPVDLRRLPENTILIADDLLPSDAVMLDPFHVKGFITRSGGKTGHIAIMARTLGIPAIVGVKDLPLKSGLEIVMDGEQGILILSPDETVRAQYIYLQEISLQEAKRRIRFAQLSSKTACGRSMNISANISNLTDIDYAVAVGAEGVGLLRTEFLFMDRMTPPSEEEQYRTYAKVLASFPKHRIIIRTLDIGGDKEISYINMPKEANPFLGYRAIRYFLEHNALLKTQLRALLRAGCHGKLAVMIPMITTLEEVIASKELFRTVQEELSCEKIPYCNNVEFGIMIEVPHAALLSDTLADHVDFFSIGTNDLIQYTLAIDRTNADLGYLYQYYHPGVLRLIAQVIRNAKNKGIHVGMCGEAAGDLSLLPLWVVLGLDSLSMSPSSILRIREALSVIDESSISSLVEEILHASDAKTVKKILDRASSFFKIC